jgi:diaminopropionate ammonia-lyase
MPRVFFNPRARHRISDDVPGRAPMRFHERLPGYATTPLVEAAGLARRLGVSSVLVKDESSRLGLPAFKVLGASWATYQLAIRRLGFEPEWQTLDELRTRFDALRPLALATATDGNHGRAVAHVARLFGFEARIFVPAGTAAARIDAIASEGATVTIVDGSYDDAVRRAAAEAGERCVIVSDTSWEGYTDVAGWVTDGYSTILHEIDDALSASHAPQPDLVVAQIGVGSLAVAMIRHYRGANTRHAAGIIGVEPDDAACALASVEAGHIVSVETGESVMAGLNCGTPSLIALPSLRDGVDAYVTVDDGRALDAVRTLATEGFVSGETGASGLAGLLELLEGQSAEEARERLGISSASRILLISTEGATDPALYQEITAMS